MSSFSDRLKYLRQRYGLSQADLGKNIGVSASAIGMYEQGRRMPPLETLEVLADYFRVDLNYLLGKSNQTTELDGEYTPYYHDPETREIADAIANDKELRMLFDAARDVSAEDLKTVHKMMLGLKHAEEENNDE